MNCNNSNAGPKNDGNKQPGKKKHDDEEGEVATAHLYSTLGIANGTSLESLPPTSSPTPLTSSPTPLTSHELHGTEIPDDCLEKFAAGNDRVPRHCRLWLEKNPDFVMPTRSPTRSPTASPSDGFEVSSVLEVLSNGTSLSSFASDAVQGAAAAAADALVNLTDLAQAAFDGASAAVANSTSAAAAASQTVSDNVVSMTYTLTPQDDTFIEMWRPEEVLGRKDKLKVDANLDGMPTKVVQLRFAVGGVLDEVLAMGVSSSCSATFSSDAPLFAALCPQMCCVLFLNTF